MKTLRTDLKEQANRIAGALGRAASVKADAAGDDVIVAMSLWPAWSPAVYAPGDVRTHAGEVWRCVQAHDSTYQTGTEPRAGSAQWAAYHATDPALARPWMQPFGAHDAYQAGEVMSWTDGKIYRCKMAAVVYGPDALPAAWELVQGGGAVEPEEPDEPDEPVTPTYPEWVQPTGGHNAHNTGDRVTYKGKVYESLINGNTWSPEAYPQGWKEVTV